MSDFKISSDRSAAVALDAVFMPITKDTPIGVKCLLINKRAGSMTIGQIGSDERFFTHWFPCPRLPNETQVEQG